MRIRVLAVLVVLFAVPAFAAISGTVMTSDGQPVAGARVSIYAPESGEARRVRLLSAEPEQIPLASTQTDAKGSYTLESPKEPVVDLRVTARGYEQVSQRIERDEEPGAIAVTKTEMKSGTVRAGGKPVAKATVVMGGTGGEFVTRTDAEGRYEVPDPKRAGVITVIHPDFAINTENFMLGGTSSSSLQRTLVAGSPLTGKVVGADGKTGVAKATINLDGWPLAVSADDGSFTIAHAPAKWTTLSAVAGSQIGSHAPAKVRNVTIKVAKGMTVGGRITDAKTKLPIAGVSVRIGARAGMRMATAESWTALTDAKGNYSLVVPPGDHMLFASHPGYDTRPVDVSGTAGQQVAKDMTVTPLARVSGVVVDEEKKPVAAATVAGESASDNPMGMPMMRMAQGSGATSGPDGRFSTRVSGDSDLRMRASRKGMPITRSDQFRLAPGERKTGMVLIIPSGVAVTGKVTDRDGNPLSGVSVGAAETQSGPRGMQRLMILAGMPGREEDAVTTATDGTFSLRLKEGTYDFSFRREGLSSKAVRAQAVTAAGPNSVSTTLEPSVEISGRVVRNGTGVEGVFLFGMSESDQSSAISGPDGSFTLSNLTAGATRVNLRKEDEFLQDMRSLTAPARDVVIDLPAGVRVSGRVVDKNTRKPVTSFSAGISTSRGGGGMVMMTPPLLRDFTSDDGSFVLENVPTGAVNIVAQAPGYTTSRMNLTLEEGKAVNDLELQLDTGVRLVGKVTGPDGSALSGVSVLVGGFGGGGNVVMLGDQKRATTDASGEYTIESLSAAEESVTFSHPKYTQTRKTVQLKGREVRQDVQLTSGQRVTGVVVTDSGAPVADADVEASASGGANRRTKTDANGAFQFESLPAARYTFGASKHGLAEAMQRDVDISTGAPVRIVMSSGGRLYGQVRGLSESELAVAVVEARSGMTSASATVDPSGNYTMEGAPVGTVRVMATVTSRGFTGRKQSATQTVELAAGGSQQVDLEFRSDTVIGGRVLRNGKPLGGAAVSFFPKGGPGSQSNASVSADEGGNYSVSGLESGEYTVNVIDMQRFSPYTTSYEVRGSGTFDIEYEASGIRGRVLDAGTGDPIENARVQMRASGTGDMFRATRNAATDVNGTFAVDFVSPGTYVVTADKDGYGNQIRDVVITASSAQDIELKLSRNDGVVLKVVDARGGNPLNASASVYEASGRHVQDSGFRFGGESGTELRLALSPGAYSATVFSPQYAPRTVTFTSPSTQTVALTPGGNLRVHSKSSKRERARLVDASGIPYPRFGTRPPSMELNASPGITPLELLAPGSYTLQILGPNDVAVSSKQVVVVEGQTMDVDI